MGFDPYQEFIYTRTYSRFLWDKGRRETWDETVSRYISFMFSTVQNSDRIPLKVRRLAQEAILQQHVMPSMRAMWSAGPNMARDNISAYNCSALAVDSIEAFGEMMYLLLAGTGAGYSVERSFTQQLPKVEKQKGYLPRKHQVTDDRIGWKAAVDFGMQSWFAGYDVIFDYSKVRPAGQPLMISGGFSSGPESLMACMLFLRETMMQAQGRQLQSIEISDMMNEIAASVVCGGVRRSSQIGLTDIDDKSMKRAKMGTFHSRRAMANLSVVYKNKPQLFDFTDEFIAMARSGSGERGIFNLYAAKKVSPQRRGKRNLSLVNPCGEVVLRNHQCCNLTEVIIRSDDDIETVRDKVITATWLGAIQSCFTYFPALRPSWTENCEEERLLGVSLSGIADNLDLCSPEALRLWKKTALKTAKQASSILGINMPAAITCVKPSGTSSQLNDCSSGIHSRWSPYYIRRVRISKTDPLFDMMVAQGMPIVDDIYSENTAVLSFPMKSPDLAKTRNQDTAIGQLELYRNLLTNWCEMNASCTIHVQNSEWLDVMKYVYDHWDSLVGVTFYPYNTEDSKHELLPYEEIDYRAYENMVNNQPKLDFSRLSCYEHTDHTTGNREYACVGGACELV
jgi:ribonucleoside-triphosphate reductase (thioredoxin)